MPNTEGGSSYQEYLVVQTEIKAEKERERKQLPLRKARVSLEDEPGSRRMRQRPHSAQVGRRRAHNSTRTTNVQRRKRLQRLIQLSSGQDFGSSPPAPTNNMSNNSTLQVPHVNVTTIQRTPHSLSQTDSNYGGSHGRGVTVSDLRKQFRAVRAYAMSGPDARKIRRNGIDPKRDVPQLSSYYTTVQVEGIPLSMGVPQLGLYDSNTSRAGPSNDDLIRHHPQNLYSEEAAAAAAVEIGSSAGISPWDDDGKLTPGRGPTLSSARTPVSTSAKQQQRHQSSPTKVLPSAAHYLHQHDGRIETSAGGKKSPRTMARKSRNRQRVPAPRINPHTRLSHIAKTSSREQLIDLERASRQPVHFKMGLNGKRAKTFRRPRTAGSVRFNNNNKSSTATAAAKTGIATGTAQKQEQEEEQQLLMSNSTEKTTSSFEVGETLIQEITIGKGTGAGNEKEKGKGRAPRPMSASMARQMGSRRVAIGVGGGRISFGSSGSSFGSSGSSFGGSGFEGYSNPSSKHSGKHRGTQHTGSGERRRASGKDKIIFTLSKEGIRNEMTALRGSGRLRGSSLKAKKNKREASRVDLGVMTVLQSTATGTSGGRKVYQRPATATGSRIRSRSTRERSASSRGRSKSRNSFNRMLAQKIY